MMKTQSGRSMIEMLGVLAIIGVLSVGGLAGYTRAMRSNRVNNIFDYAGRAWIEKRSKGTGLGESASENCSALLSGEATPAGLTSCTCERSAASVTTCVVQVDNGGKNSELNKTFATKIGTSVSPDYRLGSSWGLGPSTYANSD